MTDALANPATTQLGSTLLVIGGMQWLKKAKWFPLLQEGAVALNRFISVLLAAAVSVGITWQWNPQNHSLMIEGLTLGTILHGAFHWASQYIYQETGYSVLSGLQAMVEVASTVAPKPTAPVK